MTFLGWLSDLLKGLSDLQLGDKKVTKNHLGVTFSSWRFFHQPHLKKYEVVKNGIHLPQEPRGEKKTTFETTTQFFFGGGVRKMIGEKILVRGFFTTHLKHMFFKLDHLRKFSV